MSGYNLKEVIMKKQSNSKPPEYSDENVLNPSNGIPAGNKKIDFVSLKIVGPIWQLIQDQKDQEETDNLGEEAWNIMQEKQLYFFNEVGTALTEVELLTEISHIFELVHKQRSIAFSNTRSLLCQHILESFLRVGDYTLFRTVELVKNNQVTFL